MTEQLCPNQGEPPPAAGEVVAWLLEKAVQSADADQPKAAGMLTWAAQVIGEQSDLLECQQPPGMTGMTWEMAIKGLRDVLADESEYAIQRAWQRSRILDAVDLMEANLCRPDTPPQPERAGEVAELVAKLCRLARQNSLGIADPTITRAAELLERQQPQPVPVSERWPEFSDCDDLDRVWCWSWAIGTWRLGRINRSIHTHWLPANALPLPSEETPESKGSESPLSEFGPNDMPLG